MSTQKTEKEAQKPAPRKQAHGLTTPELETLQNDQLAEDQETTTASDGKTTINKADAGLYHVSLRIPGYNQTTGKHLHEPKVQQYSELEFKRMKESNGFAGYETEVLHVPKGATAHKAKQEGNTTAAGLQDLTDREALNVEYKKLYGAEPALTMDAVEIQEAITLKKKEANGELDNANSQANV